MNRVLEYPFVSFGNDMGYELNFMLLAFSRILLKYNQR